MLQTNQRMAFSQSQSKRKILLHNETIRGILRFTYGSALRQVPWLSHPAKPTMGYSFISRSISLRIKLLYNSYIQRRTQSQNFKRKRLPTFHEKVKEEIRTIKSLLKKNPKGTI